MPSEISAPNPEQLREAKRLLAMSPDALYEELGRQIGERGFPEDLIRSGRNRFRAIAEKSRSAICKNDAIRVATTDKEVDRAAHVATAIADTILHTMGVPVPAMTVAVLIVQSGLEKYCHEFWV